MKKLDIKKLSHQDILQLAIQQPYLSKYTNEEKGLTSFVIQISPSKFVAKLVGDTTTTLSFDNFGDAYLTSREFVGKDLCGYQIKTKGI